MPILVSVKVGAKVANILQKKEDFSLFYAHIIVPLHSNYNAYGKKLSETWEELPPMFLTSAEKKDGRDDVLSYIEQINKSLKEG